MAKFIWFSLLVLTILVTPVYGDSLQGNIELQYPVILVHGIMVYDRPAPMDFWGRIPKVLQKAGVKVYFGNTDAWGGYESNAAILKETIDRVLEENNTAKVNIIAHSKGGIDSRYAIWRYDYGDKVASLTTLGTPHNGAEVADLVYSQDLIHTAWSQQGLKTLGRLFGDQNPNILSLLREMTRENMKKFNEQVILDNRVFFQSIYVSMRTALDEPMLFFTSWYTARVAGKNDGLVSEASARWGPNQIKIEGNLSHVDLVDIKMELKPGYDIPGMYLQILRDLGERGY